MSRTIGACGVALVALLIGCNHDGAPLPPGRSGTRLEVYGWVAEGTPRRAAGVFDRELGIDCLPQTVATTGELRCMPRVRLELAWADPDCTVPIAPIFGRCLPELVSSVVVTQCGGFVEAVRTGAPITPARVYTTVTSITGECTEVSDPLEAWVQVEPVDLAMFAPMERSGLAPADGGRVGHAAYTSDDGAVFTVGRWDMERDEACRIQRSTDARWPCVPGTVGGAASGGPACDTPYVAEAPRVPACELPEAEYFVERTPSGEVCAARQVRVYRAGAPVEAVGLERCAGLSSEGEFREGLDASGELGAVDAAPEGTGRLQALPAGVPFWRSDPNYRDSELGIECVPTTVGDETRCLPEVLVPTPQARYADPMCTRRAFVVPPNTARCTDFYFDQRLDECGGTVLDGAYRRAEPVMQTYGPSPGACQPIPLEDSAQAFALEPFALDGFARMTRIAL